MNGLLMHCGAQALSRTELYGVMPDGPMGRFHNPIPYGEFVDLVSENLHVAGYRIEDEAFGTLADGSRFFGLMQVKPAAISAPALTDPVLEGEYLARGDADTRDFGLTIGLRGSYDQTLPRGLAVGSRVFVCDNLAFSGEVVMQTRQTTHIRNRLPGLVRAAMEQVGGLEQAQTARFEAYKGTPLAARHGDAALIELVRREAISPSHIGRALKVWDEPLHAEHLDTDGRRTVWTLHNAVTEAIKPVNRDRPAVLGNQPRTIAMTRFLDEVVGIDF